MKNLKFLVVVLLFVMTVLFTPLFAQDSDIDGDGVVDSQDLCPGEKGNKANKGCPEKTAKTEQTATVSVSEAEFLKLKVGYAEEIVARDSKYKKLADQYSTEMSVKLKRENLESRKSELTAIKEICSKVLKDFGDKIFATEKKFFSEILVDAEYRVKLVNTQLEIVALDEKKSDSGVGDDFLDKVLTDPKVEVTEKSAQSSQKNPIVKPTPKTPVIEIADKSVTSVSEIKDVKPDDFYYQSLMNLTERYGVITVYQDSTFRGDQPLTRRQLAVFLDSSLEMMLQLMSANKIANVDILYQRYPANNKITSMKMVKDIPPSFAGFNEIQRLYEEYGINLGDDDGYFRPNKEVTEKELDDRLKGIFSAKNDSQISPTKIVTRGKFVNDLLLVLDDKNVEFAEELEKSSKPTKSETIKNLSSKGKATITSHLKFYLPDSPCLDLKTASSEIRESSVEGGVWGDYKIKKGDIGDIVFESTDTCRKGKLVLLRVGTALVIMNENGIKRIK